MNVGTRSVLFGAHAFFYHPFSVAAGWWELYRWAPALDGGRWPALLDPRAWLAFFIHDLGYLGKPNMDGPEGERHPEPTALLISLLFDRERADVWRWWKAVDADRRPIHEVLGPWGRFVLLHSRHYSMAAGVQPSRLCAADKMAPTFTPWWLYLPGVIWSGELDEYLDQAHRSGASAGIDTSTPRRWYATMAAHCEGWAREHADGRADTWTVARGCSDARKMG